MNNIRYPKINKGNSKVSLIFLMLLVCFFRKILIMEYKKITPQTLISWVI